jgi:hypothetical protein
MKAQIKAEVTSLAQIPNGLAEAMPAIPDETLDGVLLAGAIKVTDVPLSQFFSAPIRW